MTLHIFNPEHDLALAAIAGEFTAPNNVRSLRADLGFLPALWAEEGDWVLVNDIEFAKEKMRHFKKKFSASHFVDEQRLRRLLNGWDTDASFSLKDMQIAPWGWDLALIKELKRMGVEEQLLPDIDTLMYIRELSGRKFSTLSLLPNIRKQLQETGFTLVEGESFVVDTMEKLVQLNQQYPRLVVKAPWSSSGRGIRYIINDIDPSTSGWCKNIIKSQGCITVEPYYNKVKDFGMEFSVKPSGEICYEGLSIFKTAKSMYEGSLLASEEYKRAFLAGYVDSQLLDAIQTAIIDTMQPHVAGRYTGPFGVDMMLVSTAQDAPLSVHPCVELNLRRTMGHVALTLTPSPLEPKEVMSITHHQQYALRFHTLWDDIINNGIV